LLTFPIFLSYYRRVHEGAADWFHERKHQFACTFFLDHNLSRYTYITNNAAEQTNSGIGEAKESPIVDLVVGLGRKTAKKFVMRFFNMPSF